MASAKQIAWRKKFARMSKAGEFRKGKKSSSKTLDKKIGYKDKNPTETHSYYYILYLRGTGGGKIGSH